MFSSNLSKSGSVSNGGAGGGLSLGAKNKSVPGQLSTGKGVTTSSGGVLSLNGNLIGSPSYVYATICEILMNAYENESTWPEIFVRAYIDDSLGERNWVDLAACKTFVDNIKTAFNTKPIPQQQQQQQVASSLSVITAEMSSLIGGESSVLSKIEDDNISVIFVGLYRVI